MSEAMRTAIRREVRFLCIAWTVGLPIILVLGALH